MRNYGGFATNSGGMPAYGSTIGKTFGDSWDWVKGWFGGISVTTDKGTVSVDEGGVMVDLQLGGADIMYNQGTFTGAYGEREGVGTPSPDAKTQLAGMSLPVLLLLGLVGFMAMSGSKSNTVVKA